MTDEIGRAWADFVAHSAKKGIRICDDETRRIVRAVFYVAFAAGAEAMRGRIGRECLRAARDHDEAIREALDAQMAEYRRKHGTDWDQADPTSN